MDADIFHIGIFADIKANGGPRDCFKHGFLGWHFEEHQRISLDRTGIQIQ